MESTYDLCSLYANGIDTGFGVIGLQIDDTFILAKNIFAAAEESQLIEAKLLAKNGEKLTETTPMKFNRGLIRKEADSLPRSQKRRCNGLRLVTLGLIDLTSSRGVVRKAVTPKDQYVAQRARGAYIATISQPEAAFDLSFAAQVSQPQGRWCQSAK